MIAALYALAAVMIIGGCAAVIQGFPYVRLETGLAMVIAGSVAASGGAVVFGLAALAARLRRIERAFDTRRIVDAVAAVEARSAPGAAPEPSIPRPDALRPVLPPAPLVVPPVLPEMRGIGDKVEPSFRDTGTTPVPGTGREPERPGPAPEAEPATGADRDEKPAAAPAPDDGLFADAGAPAAEPRPAEPEAVLRPGFDADPAPPQPSPEAPGGAAAPGRTIVGRHTSGGNTYVMFDDGSIEAETPRGRFTFASLDELKAFVNAGGEDGARGAA